MAKGRHGAPDLDIRLPRLCTEKGLELGKHRNQGAHPSPISLPAQVMLSWASALGQLYPQTIFPLCQQLKATHDFFFFLTQTFSQVMSIHLLREVDTRMGLGVQEIY